MADLILTFKDVNGATRQVTAAEESLFTIGRGADNNLQIADNALSRRHVQIERYGNVFVVSDAGSSNGTRLNGAELTAPVALKNNDKLLLGEAVEITIEIANEFADYASTAPNYNSAASNNYAASAQQSSGAFFQSIFFIAPVFGVFALILLFGIGFLLIDRGDDGNYVAQRNEIENLPDNNSDSSRNRNAAEESNGEVKTQETPVAKPSNANSDSLPSNQTTATPISSEDEKVEKFALQFLRGIANVESNAVLSAKQLALINAKIKSLKNSGAFRENLKAAARGNAAFDKIAQEHNLKPSFITAAALAKLGDSRGEPAAVGGSIAPEIRNYANVISLDLPEEVLLTAAAYAEGNSPNDFRDRVAALVNKNKNTTVTAARTIWFLNENNKLKPASFDFVLRLIAAGTILQDPKSFGF